MLSSIGMKVKRIYHFIWNKITFGKHKGKLLKDIDDSYLRWVRDKSMFSDESSKAGIELRRRKKEYKVKKH